MTLAHLSIILKLFQIVEFRRYPISNIKYMLRAVTVVPGGNNLEGTSLHASKAPSADLYNLI